MTRARVHSTLIALALLASGDVTRAQAPGANVSVALLYDFTVGINALSPLYSPTALVEDPAVRAFVTAVHGQLRTGDSLRFGVIANRLYLSGPSPAGADVTDFYQRVVQRFEIPIADRVGAAPVWDALHTTVSAMAPDAARRVIVVVTDGQATGNVHGFNDVVDRAKAARVTIFPLFLGDPRLLSKEWPVQPAERLATLARATGGAFAAIEQVVVRAERRQVVRMGRAGIANTTSFAYIPDPGEPIVPNRLLEKVELKVNVPDSITEPIARIFADVRRR